MPTLPKIVLDAWKNRVTPAVFSTADRSGTPNAVYVTCVHYYQDDAFVIADNFFHKTNQNINDGGYGSLLFITEDKKSFQFKGEIRRVKAGPYFDFMKSWNPERLPGHAAVVFTVTEIYSGAESIDLVETN